MRRTLVLEPLEEQDLRYSGVCRLCSRSFSSNIATKVVCGKCYIIAECGFCSKEFVLSRKKQSLYQPSLEYYCSNSCKLESKTAAGECNRCKKFSAQRGATGLCDECGKAQGRANWELAKKRTADLCGSCGAITVVHPLNKMCRDCHRAFLDKIRDKVTFTPYGACKSCEEETNLSASGWCAVCLGEAKCIKKPNWVYSSPKCEKHPDEAKQALKAEHYECWSCIKDSFALREMPDIPGAFWQSTYRTNGYSTAGQFMMEEELVECGIGWFVYIKGYIDPLEGEWRPLVVGKTGSKLVQPSGTDIRFKISDHTLAQEFLVESELSWDDSKILVIPVETEKDAYCKESDLQKMYGLLGS